MKYSKLLPLAAAILFAAPLVSFACATNADCTAPGQTCLASGACGYAAGSPMANCLDTCAGTCTINASTNAVSCSTTSAAGSCTGPSDTSCGSGNSCQQNSSGFYQCFPSGQCGNTGAACPSGSVCQLGSCVSTTGTGGTPLTGGGTGGINTTYLQGYETSIVTIINTLLVPLLIAVAFIVFLWGVVNAYILHPDDESKRSAGHTYILWGIIGFVIILSLWGLVAIVSQTIGISGGSAASHGLAAPTI